MKKAISARPKVRRRWVVNPKTRVRENKKRYRRQIVNKEVQRLLKETENG
jgi:hypothetical protein